MIWLGNRAAMDVINSRWAHAGERWAASNTTGRWTHTRRTHRMMQGVGQGEASTGHRTGKMTPKQQKLGRGSKHILPHSPPEEPTLPAHWWWVPATRTVRQQIPSISGMQFVRLLQTLQQTNAIPKLLKKIIRGRHLVQELRQQLSHLYLTSESLGLSLNSTYFLASC